MRRVPKDMIWIIMTLLVIWLVLTNLTDPPASTPLSNVVLVSTLIPLGILIGARRELTKRQLAQYPGWTSVVARTTSTQEQAVIAAGFPKTPRATLLYGPAGVQLWGGPEYTLPLFDHPWSEVTGITEAPRRRHRVQGSRRPHRARRRHGPGRRGDRAGVGPDPGGPTAHGPGHRHARGPERRRPMSSAQLWLIVVTVTLVAWAIVVGVMVRQSRRRKAQRAGAFAATRPGWAVLAALPSTEVVASLRAQGQATTQEASLLYGPVGIELVVGTRKFVALRWSKLAQISEADLTLPGTHRAKGVRFEVVDGRILELRLLPSRQLRAHYPGTSLQGAAVAELLAVRGGARPASMSARFRRGTCRDEGTCTWWSLPSSS